VTTKTKLWAIRSQRVNKQERVNIHDCWDQEKKVNKKEKKNFKKTCLYRKNERCKREHHDHWNASQCYYWRPLLPCTETHTLSLHVEVQPTRRACPRGTVRDIGVEIRKLVGERVWATIEELLLETLWKCKLADLQNRFCSLMGPLTHTTQLPPASTRAMPTHDR
jgi:hypothetical protein